MSETNPSPPPLLLPQYSYSTAKKIAEEHGFRMTGQGLTPKLLEYDAFVTFCATPSHLRSPDEMTEMDFQRNHKVGPSTTLRWKNRKTFQSSVRARMRDLWGQQRVPDVIWGVARVAIKHGKVKEAAYFIEYMTGYTSKNMLAAGKASDTQAEEFTMDDVRKMLSCLPPERKKYFNDIIIQIFNEAAEYSRRTTEADDGADDGELRGDPGELPREAHQPYAPSGSVHQMAQEDS